GRRVMVDEVVDILIGSILKRRSMGSSYGIAVLAEGLMEAIGEQGLKAMMATGELGRYGKIVRDPHGHLRLGEIEFGRMMKDRLAAKMEELKLPVTVIDKDLGYELRCADPIPFDAEYTRDLGYGAVKFLGTELSAKCGAIISYEEGSMKPLPFEEKLDPVTKRMTTRIVKIEGESYQCARSYM